MGPARRAGVVDGRWPDGGRSAEGTGARMPAAGARAGADVYTYLSFCLSNFLSVCVRVNAFGEPRLPHPPIRHPPTQPANSRLRRRSDTACSADTAGGFKLLWRLPHRPSAEQPPSAAAPHILNRG